MHLSYTYRRARILAASTVLAGVGLGAPMPATPQSPPRCEPASALVRVPELPEGSGLAASRRTPGRFWTHNDSGNPVLFALDGSGRLSGRLQLSGARVDDWESVAVGPCPAGSCLYVADIGDNAASRRRITIYRIAEPEAAAGSANVTDVFHATYPDRPQDAESLLVAADGRLYIVTKGDTGPVAIYRFPAELKSGTTMSLERVGKPRAPSAKDRITDGAVSPDGQWVVLRTELALLFYRASDLFGGNWLEAGRVPLNALREPQGEGVTFGADDSVYLMSEGGGRQRPGTFARLTCTLNP